jgi:MscS family membrane protein
MISNVFLARRSSLPDSLSTLLWTQGPLDLTYAAWCGLVLSLPLSWASGMLLGRVTRILLGRIARGTATGIDDRLVSDLAGPITLGWSVLLARGAVGLFALPKGADDLVSTAGRLGFVLAAFWGVWRLVGVVKHVAVTSSWGGTSPAARALGVLGARVAKALVMVLGIVTGLSLLGYPVATLIAGLGIGGIAFALAAQKTVENLFGAFSLGVDQPFREGDFIKLEGALGTVEAIGLRSTRIRSLDRTVISIPNGKVAEMQVESLAVRDRLRLACMLGLEYGTSVERLRSVLSGLSRVLRDHPKIWPDTVIVRFVALAESSLDIEVMAWFTTTDWNEFLEIREAVLLGFMEVVEREGCSFAFPTRTVHLAGNVADAVRPNREDRA